MLEAARGWFPVALAALLCTGAAQAAGVRHAQPAPPGSVTLSPGDDIQAAVDAHPAGTSFFLNAGVYRIQSVVPKRNDSFTGDGGAVLNGARLLDDFDAEGGLFVARGVPIDPDTQVQGVCRKGYPRCGHPQDLYLDGAPLRAVAKKSKVVPGAFYYDYAAEAVYFADDPAGHTVELSYRPHAFAGEARGVTIQNLIVEKYASADQQGAIGDHGEGAGWTIAGNEVRWNHGVGVVGGAFSRIDGNYIHHNGEMGVAGGGVPGSVVSGNEIAFNVWNGTDCGWECGGAKWAQMPDLQVIGNYVHDNAGDGLWTDIDCSNVVYDGNRIEDNLYAGISHEISGTAIIRNNIFKGNGARTFGWGWQGQIQIQNSSDTEVFANTLVLDRRRGGNGIMIVQQNRGAKHMPRRNSIHDNDITMAGGEGAAAGWFADYKPKAFAQSGNLFDSNRYQVYAPDGDLWAPNEWTSFAAWQATGQDAHSTLDGVP